MKRVLFFVAAIALAGCGANGGFSPAAPASGDIAVQTVGGVTLNNPMRNPFRTDGDVFNVSEGGYSGSFSAVVTSWNLADTLTPCYVITQYTATGFAIAERGPICVGGFKPDIEGITFADSQGHSVTQYFAPT